MSKLFYKILNAEPLTKDSIVDQQNMDDSFDPASLSNKYGPGFPMSIVPDVILDNPPFDPTTQYLSSWAIVGVYPDRVERQRTVGDYTQEVIDDFAELKLLKTIALDLRDGVGDGVTRLTRLEKFVFYMAKDFYMGK